MGRALAKPIMFRHRTILRWVSKGVLAAKGDPSGNTPASHKTPSPLLHKNIALYRHSECQYQSAIPVQGEGRSSVVTNVDRGVVDAAASGTKTGPGREDPREGLSSVRTTGRQRPAKPFGAKQDVSGEASWKSRIAAYGKIVWSGPSLLRPSL